MAVSVVNALFLVKEGTQCSNFGKTWKSKALEYLLRNHLLDKKKYSVWKLKESLCSLYANFVKMSASFVRIFHSPHSTQGNDIQWKFFWKRYIFNLVGAWHNKGIISQSSMKKTVMFVKHDAQQLKCKFIIPSFETSVFFALRKHPLSVNDESLYICEIKKRILKYIL